MKVYAFFLILFAMSTGIIQAQDLIVTYDNDSIDCQITKVRNGDIYFTYKNNNNTRNSIISLDDVEFYDYDYFTHQYLYSEEVFTDQAFPRIRIAINGGWSYRPAKVNENIPSDIVPYMKKLRPGYHIGANISYYFKESLGTGIKFNYFNSKNEENNTSMGDLRDNISIYFIGPTFGSRLLSRNNNNGWIFNVGLGYLGYRDKGSVNSQELRLKGGTFGVSWDAGYDISISDNFAIGIQFSYVIGTLTSLKMSNGYSIQKVKLEKDNYENLSQINLSVGFRFYAK